MDNFDQNDSEIRPEQNPEQIPNPSPAEDAAAQTPAEPVAPSAQPMSDAAQPVFDAGQPTSDTAQPAFDAGQPMSDTAQPAFDAGQPYHSAGTGRKESPFADSPYVTWDRGGYRQNTSGWQQPPAPKAKKPKRAKSGTWKKIVAAAAAVVILAGSCGLTALAVNSRWEKETARMQSAFDQKLDALEKQVSSLPSSGTSVSGSPVAAPEGGLTPSQVYAQNVKSVVAINNQATTNIYGQVTETASSGSGFILTEDGYIVTNYHVIAGASRLTVITADKTEYDATYVGGDESNDVALLKIDATGLPAVTIGSSDDLIVGDQVVAIGNPLGELTNTQTVGYVSAKDRDVATDGRVISMIQTDAAINPGNSGGPLFNMKGEVVGITTAKYSGTTSSGASIEGIGFAIPIDDVLPIIEDLQSYGYVTGAYLGVMVRDMDESTAKMFNLPMGAYVESVTEGYCAERAGVQAKDIIIGLGSTEIASRTDLTRALRKLEPGDTTTLTVYRSGQQLSLSITLDERPREDAEEPAANPSMPGGSIEDFYDFFDRYFGGRNQG